MSRSGRVQQQIDATYETFVQRVADGREMSRDDVHAIAQGRVIVRDSKYAYCYDLRPAGAP